jgi:integrase
MNSRTLVTLLLCEIVHPTLDQELLGDTSVAITTDTYSHILPGMGGEAADAMGATLG